MGPQNMDKVPGSVNLEIYPRWHAISLLHALIELMNSIVSMSVLRPDDPQSLVGGFAHKELAHNSAATDDGLKVPSQKFKEATWKR